MANSAWSGRLGRILGAAVKAGAIGALRNLTRGSRTGPARSSSRTSAGRSSRAPAGRGAPSARVTTQARDLSDFPGTPVMEYQPRPDGQPDPGEIVWTWVPFEEDHTRGKDRPVLLIGHDGDWLLGLMLTSQDHDRDAGTQAHYGRHWFDIGTGDWDPQRRPSEVRVDRVLRIDSSCVRREGAVLDRTRFDRVAAEVARVHQLKRS